jgi:single-strand DNA-binding protein
MFGKRAEVINKYVKKGDPLFVEGRLKFDSWQAQDGSKRSKLRVMVESFEFMGKGGTGEPAKPQRQQGEHQDMGYGQDEDIPF